MNAHEQAVNEAEKYVDRMPRYPFLNQVNRPEMIKLFTEARLEGAKMMQEKAVLICKSFGDEGLERSIKLRIFGTQQTEKGLAIAGERLERAIRALNPSEVVKNELSKN